MNERIQALVDQATSRPYRDQGIGGEPTHIYPGTFSVEKFAELLVRECIDVVDVGGEFVSRPKMVERLKQHFGVES